MDGAEDRKGNFDALDLDTLHMIAGFTWFGSVVTSNDIILFCVIMFGVRLQFSKSKTSRSLVYYKSKNDRGRF